MTYNRRRVGIRLQVARLAAGLEQKEVARRAGVVQPTVSMFETGARDGRIGTLLAICAAIGVQPGYILDNLEDGDGEPTQDQ